MREAISGAGLGCDAMELGAGEVAEDDGAEDEIEAPFRQMIDGGPAVASVNDVDVGEATERDLGLELVVDDEEPPPAR